MRKQLPAILVLTLPLTAYLLTLAPSAGFADAAEFAYVTKVWGVPHPPGFPSYVFFAFLWSKACSFFTGHVTALTLFSAFSEAFAVLLLYLSLVKILYRYAGKEKYSPQRIQWSACFASLSFAFGMTAWQWSNTIEVYAFHVLSMALLLYGLVSYAGGKNRKLLIIAALGLGLGLANHHLTLIMALPFLLLFFDENTLSIDKKKNRFSIQETFLRNKNFFLFTVLSAVVTLLFYGLLYYRAQSAYPFAFGNPDNLSRMFYHLSGGLWLQHSVEATASISQRFPYFMMLIFRQYFVFLPFLFAGWFLFFKKRSYRLLSITLGYLLLLLIYQLRMVQTADTDAYLLLPFYLSTIAVAVGICRFADRSVKLFIPAAGVVIIFLFNYRVSDRSQYDVGHSLMQDLSSSAPFGSIVLVSEWTLRIQYLYHSQAEGFREDLIVLRSDLKGSNYRCLQEEYPDFYKKIEKEYKAYLNTLAVENDYYIYSDYYTIANREQDEAYRIMIKKVFAVAAMENRQVLIDRQTVKFLTEINLVPKNDLYPSGLFFSLGKGGTGYVLKADASWMKTKFVNYDPAASNTIQDYYELITQCTGFYRFTGDTVSYRESGKQVPLITAVKNKHRKQMPFAWTE